MKHEILITTFDIWEVHHTSNASDDLLQLFEALEYDFFHSLRKIPVDFEHSTRSVVEHFERLQPKVLICCGMAEDRSRLNVESRAIQDESILYTGIDLEALTADLSMTDISHDAGQFVCNTLYFNMLSHFEQKDSDHHCIFVHVPVLTEENSEQLLTDFVSIIERLTAQEIDKYLKG